MLNEPQEMPVSGTGIPQGIFTDQLTGNRIEVEETLRLGPYEVLWLDVTALDQTGR